MSNAQHARPIIECCPLASLPHACPLYIAGPTPLPCLVGSPATPGIPYLPHSTLDPLPGKIWQAPCSASLAPPNSPHACRSCFNMPGFVARLVGRAPRKIHCDGVASIKGGPSQATFDFCNCVLHIFVCSCVLNLKMCNLYHRLLDIQIHNTPGSVALCVMSARGMETL